MSLLFWVAWGRPGLVRLQVFYDFRATGSHSIVYDNTVLTVSNQTMAFSDLPPLGEARNHWHWTEYNAYLRKYVDFYNLEQHIRFDVQVVECVSSDGGSKWTVTTECTKTMARASHAFDALVVCSGTHRVPKVRPSSHPAIPQALGPSLPSA